MQDYWQQYHDRRYQALRAQQVAEAQAERARDLDVAQQMATARAEKRAADQRAHDAWLKSVEENRAAIDRGERVAAQPPEWGQVFQSTQEMRNQRKQALAEQAQSPYAFRGDGLRLPPGSKFEADKASIINAE